MLFCPSPALSPNSGVAEAEAVHAVRQHYGGLVNQLNDELERREVHEARQRYTKPVNIILSELELREIAGVQTRFTPIRQGLIDELAKRGSPHTPPTTPTPSIVTSTPPASPAKQPTLL